MGNRSGRRHAAATVTGLSSWCSRTDFEASIAHIRVTNCVMKEGIVS